MMKMRKALILFFLLLATPTLAFQDNIKLDIEDLPTKKTFTLNVTTYPNESIYINRTDNSEMNVSFPSKVQMGNNTMTGIDFEISIPKYYENKTLTSLFNLTNSYSNNSYIYNITANIVYNKTIIEDKDEHFIDLLEGDYYLNISRNVLPRSGSLYYSVEGANGTKLNIDCIDKTWLDCPKERTFDEKNKTSFRIIYEIPKNTSNDEYKREIELTTGNKTLKTKIIFNIKGPITDIKKFEFEDDCYLNTTIEGNKEIVVKKECIDNWEEWNIERMTRYLNKIKELKLECSNTTVYKPKYVVTGNISKDMKELYEECKDNNDDLERSNDKLNDKIDNKVDKISSLSNNLEVCHDNLSNAQKNLAKEWDDCLDESNERAMETYTEGINKYRQTKRMLWSTIITIVVLVLIVSGIYYTYKKKNQEKWT